VVRKRLNYPELKKAVLIQIDKHDPRIVLIEDKASGTQLIQEMRSEGQYQMKPYPPPSGTDKIMRLHAQTAQFESGRVHLPSSASWLQDYVWELTTFPGTKFDDQVDSTTQALDPMSFGRCISIFDVL